jgi:carbonic anhydrase
MEFGCKLAGTRLIVVLGHTACGAVKGACDDAKLGNLTRMLAKIKPAVAAVAEPQEPSLRNSSNAKFVDDVSAKNVEITIDNIMYGSEVLAEMQNNGEVRIIGAMYDIATGAVIFYE